MECLYFAVENEIDMAWIKYIGDAAHYNEVLSRAASVKSSLWIGTADIKDLYVKAGADQIPFLGVISRLIERGADVRLIHAKEPGPIFREEFDRYPLLAARLERALCPRVHFKIMVFDCNTAYVGSANLTGAGMGMKGSSRRNFEAGILTDEPSLVAAAMDHFDGVWSGMRCKGCLKRKFCGAPIDEQ